MVVAVSDANSAPGLWRWNVKQHRQNRWKTIVTSNRAYLSRGDAVQAAEDSMSVERTWDRSDPPIDC